MGGTRTSSSFSTRRTHAALADQLELLELGEPAGEFFDRQRLRTARRGRPCRGIGPFADVESGAQGAGRADPIRRVGGDGGSTVGTDAWSAHTWCYALGAQMLHTGIDRGDQTPQLVLDLGLLTDGLGHQLA